MRWINKNTVAILLLSLLTGCGSGRSPVAGEITFDGKPVQEGTIVFEPTDRQGPATGGKIVDGKYALTGKAAPLPGKKTVRISAVQKTGRKMESRFATPKNMIDEVELYIPKIYNTNSTLTCEVSPDGSKTINFDLKTQ